MNKFIVSVDLGFSQDPTAIAVLERDTRPTGAERRQWRDRRYCVEAEWASYYKLRHLERPPLRTSYLDIVTRIGVILQHPDLRDAATLCVDATGVGRPVVQLMRQHGLEPIPIVITGGIASSIDVADWTRRVPKKELVSGLTVVFQNSRIEIAKQLQLAPALLKELDAFRLKTTKAGNDTFEAWRESDHDDLVFAVAMGVWLGEREYPRGWKVKNLNPQSEEAQTCAIQTAERIIEDESDKIAREYRERIADFRLI